MSGVPSHEDQTAARLIAQPASFAAIWARTTPATVLRSQRAIPSRPSFFAVTTSSSGWDAPLQKGKIAGDDGFKKHVGLPDLLQANCPCRNHLGADGFAVIKAFAKKPVAMSLRVLDAKIIAGLARGSCFAHHDRNPLGSFNPYHLVQHLAPAKADGRPLGHLGNCLNGFGHGKQPQGRGGRSPDRFCLLLVCVPAADGLMNRFQGFGAFRQMAYFPSLSAQNVVRPDPCGKSVHQVFGAVARVSDDHLQEIAGFPP